MRKNYLYAVTTVLIWSTMTAVVKKMLFDIPNLEALSIRYTEKDLPEMIEIWNEVVEEGVAFPQEDYLTRERN
ncbi:MAG: hypothetical protein IJ282_02665 [Lachnospiraceae bacterium]|nr:hypothetical protein [Lachnospiraceae bacterium]